jgi:uncharacterized membrane protein YfcA
MILVLTPLLFGPSFLSGMLGPRGGVIASIAAMIGGWLGARFTAGKVKSATLSRIFAVALVALAAQRAWILLT